MPKKCSLDTDKTIFFSSRKSFSLGARIFLLTQDFFPVKKMLHKKKKKLLARKKNDISTLRIHFFWYQE